MESLREILDSIGAHLRTRFANPLYGAYLFSWAVINFRLLLVLLGNGTWREKIDYIDTVLYPHWWWWGWFGVAYPLLVAIALVVTSPFAQRWVAVFLREREKTTIQRLLQIAEETPLSPDAASRLHQRMVKQQIDHKQEISEYSKRLEEADAQIERLTKLQSASQDSVIRPAEPANVAPFAATAPATEPPGSQLLSDSDMLEVKESDFSFKDQRVTIPLAMNGIRRQLAEALDSIRNANRFNASDLQRYLSLEERFEAIALTEKLANMGLTELESSPGNYRINSAGRELLVALRERGFARRPRRDQSAETA